MPGLVVLGRRLKIAGDDLRPLSTFTVLVRLVQLGIVSPVIRFIDIRLRSAGDPYESFLDCVTDPTKSRQRSATDVFIIAMIVYVTASTMIILSSILIEAAMFHFSSLGTPTQPEKRSKVGPLFAVRILVIIPMQFVLVAVGVLCISFSRKAAECSRLIDDNVEYTIIEHAISEPWYSCFLALVFTQATEVLVLFAVCGSRTGRFFRDHFQLDCNKADSTDQTYSNRCVMCCLCCGASCCFSFGGRGLSQEHFDSISQILADYLDKGSFLDIVTSDVVMSLLVLVMVQWNRRMKFLQNLEDITETHKNWDVSGAHPDVILLNDDMEKVMTSLRLGDPESRGDDSAFYGAHGKRYVDLPWPVWFVVSNVSLLSTIPPFDTSISKDSSIKTPQPLYENGSMAGNLSPTTLHRRKSVAYRAQYDGRQVRYDFAVRDVLSRQHSLDVHTIAEGARFIKYAEAINTWKYLAYTKPCTGLCQLTAMQALRGIQAFGRTFCTKPTAKEGAVLWKKRVVGDNCLGMNEAALMQLLGFDSNAVELVYASFVDTVEQGPYCVMLDHVWKSVVVCVRGSLSVEDYVVNISVDPNDMEGVGKEFDFDGRGEFCHGGFLNRARWIYHDLERTNVLHQLMDHTSGTHPSYSLRVIGHSLGAACAAPLALMLRKTYKNLRCLCFGPPGALFSLPLAKRCKSFLTSYVNDTDLVPRLSVETMERLRDEILQLTARIRVPKYRVHRAYILYSGQDDLSNVLDEMLYSDEKVPKSNFKHQVAQFHENQNRLKQEHATALNVALYPPGKVVHMVKTKQIETHKEDTNHRCMKCATERSKFLHTPKWAEVDDFNEILVSKTLLSDHLVDTYVPVLQQIAESFGVDPSSPPRPPSA